MLKTYLFLTLILSNIDCHAKTDQQQEKIKKQHTQTIHNIHIACDHWKDICNKDGSGLYLDIIREVYAQFGITMTHSVEPFKRSLVSVTQGKADSTPGAFLTPQRASLYLYPLTRITTEYTALLYRSNQPEITSPLGIRGSVIKLRGYDYSRYEPSHSRFIEVSKASQAIDMLALGRADYMMHDYQDALIAIKDHAANKKDYKITIIGKDATYPVFQKNQRGKQLGKLWDIGMQQLYDTGQLKNLVQRYQLPAMYNYYPELEKSPTKQPSSNN